MPTFKTDLDLQHHQLKNAVLHNLDDLPPNPVEGQVYFNKRKQLAYLWDGNYWLPWGQLSLSTETKQYMLNIPNPSDRIAFIFTRLFQDQLVMRIDSHISNEGRVGFLIESRISVNDPGDSFTDDLIRPTHQGLETTTFQTSLLPAGNWLYINIREVDGIVSMLTITITCKTL